MSTSNSRSTANCTISVRHLLGDIYHDPKCFYVKDEVGRRWQMVSQQITDSGVIVVQQLAKPGLDSDAARRFGTALYKVHATPQNFSWTLTLRTDQEYLLLRGRGTTRRNDVLASVKKAWEEMRERAYHVRKQRTAGSAVDEYDAVAMRTALDKYFTIKPQKLRKGS